MTRSIPYQQSAQRLASRLQCSHRQIANTLSRVYRKILGRKIRALSDAVNDQHFGRGQRARGDSVGERLYKWMLIVERVSAQTTGSTPGHGFFREREADDADDVCVSDATN